MSDDKSRFTIGSGRGRLLSLLRQGSEPEKVPEHSSESAGVDSGFKTGDNSGKQQSCGRGKLFASLAHTTIGSTEKVSMNLVNCLCIRKETAVM